MWRVNNRATLWTFSTNTQSNMVKCWAFRNQWITLITTGFTWTIKFYASNSDETWTIPDLSTTANTTNEFSTVQITSLVDWSNIDWNTWITFTADTSVLRYEINDNNVNWLWIKTSLVSVWNIEVKLDLTDNQ